MKKQPYKSTTLDLPIDIMTLVPEWESIPLIKQIVQEAKAGEFHDFKNDKYVAPKVALANLLFETKEPRLVIIRESVVAGIYDEQFDGKFKCCSNCQTTIMCNKAKDCVLLSE